MLNLNKLKLKLKKALTKETQKSFNEFKTKTELKELLEELKFHLEYIEPIFEKLNVDKDIANYSYYEAEINFSKQIIEKIEKILNNYNENN